MRDAAKHFGGAARGCCHDNEVAHPFEQIFNKTAGILTRLNDAVNRRKSGPGITRTEGIDHFVEQLSVRVAEQCNRTFVDNGLSFRTSDELVEQRESVAH